MAHEPTREELMTEARMREQLGPERQTRPGRRHRDTNARVKPHWHEIKPGQWFGVTVYMRPGHDWPEDSFTAYFNNRFIWEWPGKEGLGFLWHRPGEPMFAVRVVCAPIRRSDEWLLVERISDGRLAVMPVGQLYFLDPSPPD